ncbi:MAG: putative cytokinetic ring protein SteA [Armatimonadota bacterium]
MRFPYMKPGHPLAHLLLPAKNGNGKEISGLARADRRTKRLAQRLRPGEIAVIDHLDLDGPAAEALVACRVSAVINAAPSISGRYPNRGPEVLLAAGIPLIDGAGSELLDRLRDGDHLIIRGEAIYLDGANLAHGRCMTPARLETEITQARENLDVELRRFVRNTLSYVEEEEGLLFEAANLPNFAIELRDRHVLVVVRGEGARQDLAAIQGYIRDRRPVLIGVDGGADLLRELGFTPQVIFGDMDSVSDGALRCGAQLIVHAYPDGRCPGQARLDALGLRYEVLPGRGTSEDVILLVAYEKGAELIIAVGTHFNLIDFLDKARGGMSSTFLVRLRVGSRLVDAKGVSRLYPAPYPLAHFGVMILTVLCVGAVIVMLSREVQSFLQLLVMQVQRLLGL